MCDSPSKSSEALCSWLEDEEDGFRKFVLKKFSMDETTYNESIFYFVDELATQLRMVADSLLELHEDQELDEHFIDIFEEEDEEYYGDEE